MNSIAEILTGSWHLHFWTAALLILTSVVYGRGWWKLHQRRPDYFALKHLLCFLAGEIALFVAIASPLHDLAEISLTPHMIQHIFLMMVVPPLILLGTPHLPLLFGLFGTPLERVLRPVALSASLKRVGQFLLHPATCWIAFVGATLAWHTPVMFEFALRSEFWHALEHICFLATAFFFWWPVIQPWPSRGRWPRWAMIPYLLLADFQNTALSAFLIFCDRIVYPRYATAARIFGMSAIEDQAAAGAIMWVPGSFAFLIPMLWITIRVITPNRGSVRPSSASFPSSSLLRRRYS
jgi:cytochrome c oxidase assembly factor CtaG